MARGGANSRNPSCLIIESVHPLHGPELRALRPLKGKSPYVFVTEAGSPVTTAWFLRMVGRTGKAARLPFPVHPHMLRHSTGYKLANDGHDTRSLAHYLGHRRTTVDAKDSDLSLLRMIGGAGTFDGIFLTGILAVLLASLYARTRLSSACSSRNGGCGRGQLGDLRNTWRSCVADRVACATRVGAHN